MAAKLAEEFNPETFASTPLAVPLQVGHGGKRFQSFKV